MYYSSYNSPLGIYTMAADEKHLLGLWKIDQKYYDQALPSLIIKDDKNSILTYSGQWLDEYFKGNRPEISLLPLNPMGSEFRKKIWNILRHIPYGETISYGEISELMARVLDIKSMSAQAVGGAVGHNPLSIIIPCHRVVGKNGGLTGYAGGLSTKVRLLKHEGADLSKLFVPMKSPFYDDFEKLKLG